MMIKFQKLLNEELVEYWFSAYIDLLHRLQLWNVATQIIQHASMCFIFFGVNSIIAIVSNIDLNSNVVEHAKQRLTLAILKKLMIFFVFIYFLLKSSPTLQF